MYSIVSQSGKATHLVARSKSNYVEEFARAILKSYALRARERDVKGHKGTRVSEREREWSRLDSEFESVLESMP